MHKGSSYFVNCQDNLMLKRGQAINTDVEESPEVWSTDGKFMEEN